MLSLLGLATGPTLIRAESAVPPPAPPAEQRTVELPPCVSEAASLQRWRYARAGDVEVLSQWPDDVTRRVIDSRNLLQAELAALIPPAFQVQRPVPAMHVLFGNVDNPAVAAQLAARIKQFAGMPLDTDPEDPFEAEDAQAARAAIDWVVRFQTYDQLWDADTFATYQVAAGSRAPGAELGLKPRYLRYLLEARTPGLPSWFIEGMIELQRIALTLTPPPTLSGDLTTPIRSAGVSLAPAQWLSPEESARLRADPASRPTLMPLGVLFGGLRLGVNQAAEIQLRRSEAALFIRWALDVTKPETQTGHPPEGSDLERLEPGQLQPQALWTYLDRAGREPANEALFQECFGQTYAEAEVRLRDYLPYALTHTIALKAPDEIALPGFELRDATAAEVSRLRGELARLEIDLIKEDHPPLTTIYREQFRQIVQPGLDRGSRDPQLLAIAGLAESATGNDEAARPLLEAAVAARLPRARIYQELARIHFNEVRPTKPEAKITSAQAAPALELLALGLKQAQPLAENYELVAEIWLRTAGRLTREQLAVLDEGIRIFPRRMRLVYLSALVYGFTGLDGHARALVEQGLANCLDEGEKSRLLKLWSAIHADWGESYATGQPAATTRWKGPKLKPEIVPRALAEKEEPVVQLKAVKVSEVFPPINVRFNLSGTNLFNTLDDPIIDAEVTYVQSGGLGARMGIQVGDILLALNGADLRGRTIREVAALVEAARQAGDLMWSVRRGTSILTLRHKGRWEIPLPAVAK